MSKKAYTVMFIADLFIIAKKLEKAHQQGNVKINSTLFVQWNTAIQRGNAILITDNNMNKSQKQCWGKNPYTKILLTEILGEVKIIDGGKCHNSECLRGQ